MSVSTVTGIANLQVQSGPPPSAMAVRGADRDGDQDGTGRPGRPGGGQLLSAVAQTLSQLGVGQVGQIVVTAPTAMQRTSGDNTAESAPANNGQNSGQALLTFMHSLFQAVNQGAAPVPNASAAAGGEGGGQAKPLSPAGATGYTDLVSNLQRFVQNLGNASTASSSATSQLNTAFQNLEQTLGAKDSGAGGNSSQITLQTFLQSLLQNLQSGGPALGGMANWVSTSA